MQNQEPQSYALGYTIGYGQLRYLVDKVHALMHCPIPSTKRQVWQFLGLAEYYQCLILGFTTIAAPVTDLTKEGHPKKIQWMDVCAEALKTLKESLRRELVLFNPDFSKKCSFYRQMPQMWVWGQCCHKSLRGKNIQYHTSVGSYFSQRKDIQS